ncbi:hypothetical protein KUTeg_021265 [Tegillarca granosa]|uniref:Secreted protein n=1 Tax=Tegillarca granosa TaxID=220873 RepID=A0ABQ9EG95_TEGGR|nr:hypothetical protein KUTeg_021265 [Tegillarca granosa]
MQEEVLLLTVWMTRLQTLAIRLTSHKCAGSRVDNLNQFTKVSIFGEGTGSLRENLTDTILRKDNSNQGRCPIQ